jgi:FtsP/CotA-like multicopper oxidase with cupredoxin domain
MHPQPSQSPRFAARRRRPGSPLFTEVRQHPRIALLTAGIIGLATLTTTVSAFGATSGTGATLPATTPTITKFTEQLTVPQLIDKTAGGAVALDEVSGTHKFHAAMNDTPTWGYVPAGTTPSDTNLGPTIEVKRGNPVDLTVNNKLTSNPTAGSIDHMLMGVQPTDDTAPRTALHLHGSHDAASEDGGPTETFTPGQSHTYHYINDQQAAGLWYHDHALSNTRLNVVNGLAGSYLVRDAYDTGRAGNPEGLPTGKYEVPLTLQDKAFNPDGTINYMTGTPGAYTMNWIPEYFGDTAVVNGKVSPNLNVDRGVYRFRVVNASNARFYDLNLQNSTGAQLYKIGQSGGLLNKPVPEQDLIIAPGDRADVLIDFSKAPAGTKIVLNNSAKAPYPSGPRAAKQGGVPLPDIMQFTVGSTSGATTAVPATLRGGKGQPAAIPAAVDTPSNVRNVYLNEILDPATGDSQRVLLNNQSFDSYQNGQIETPKPGTVEQWNIINTTGDAHPLHLHLVQFRVLGRQGFNVTNYTAKLNQSLPAPGLPDPAAAMKGPWPAPSADPYAQGTNTAPNADEAGWTDVVVAPPGQITRIVAAYGGTDSGIKDAPYTSTISDPTGAAYVWHCHILEHEDNDMMQQMRVQ